MVYIYFHFHFHFQVEDMNQEVQDAPDLFIVPVPSNEALSDTRKPAHARLSKHVARKGPRMVPIQARVYTYGIRE